MLKRIFLIALFVLSFIVPVILLTGFDITQRNIENSDFYLGGIKVSERNNQEWAGTIKASGMNTISTTVYARNARWDSDWLWFDRADTAIVDEIRAAKEEGLRVVLILRTLLDWWFPENQFMWHGMILPRSDAELQKWFATYSEYAIKWATIAEQYDIDVFVIGSELNMLSATRPVAEFPELLRYYLDAKLQLEEKNNFLHFADELRERHLFAPGRKFYASPQEFIEARQERNRTWAEQVAYHHQGNDLERFNQRRSLLNKHWIKVIRDVRKIYSGKISYAANFDNYQEVDFWQHLDFIGINAYFHLRDKLSDEVASDSLLSRLQDGWQSVFAEIDSFRIRSHLANTPVIFTELGFTYRKNSTMEPWARSGFSILNDQGKKHLMLWDEEPFDYHERAMAIRALYAVNQSFENPFLKGILYWKLSTKAYHIPSEPFLLCIGSDSFDPMLPELLRFVQ